MNAQVEPESQPERRSTDAEVGRRVHLLMWDAGLTQTAFGARLGIDQSSLAKKLRGTRGWSLDEIVVVARELNVSVAYLFGEAGDGNVVHPLGLEPRTHCFSDELAPVISIDSARSLRSWGGEAA